MEKRIMPFEDITVDTAYMLFDCRGCNFGQNEEVWVKFLRSQHKGGRDNSYLELREDPDNRYDPEAIQVMSRGELFGFAGFVGREFTKDVKKVLRNCNRYRVDIADLGKVKKGIDRDIRLVLRWV